VTLDELMRRAEEITAYAEDGVYTAPSEVADDFMRALKSYRGTIKPFPSSIKHVDAGGMKVVLTNHARERLAERVPGTKNDKITAIRRAVSGSYFTNGGLREYVNNGMKWVFEELTSGGYDLRLITITPI
jgi:hypothetical protein